MFLMIMLTALAIPVGASAYVRLVSDTPDSTHTTGIETVNGITYTYEKGSMEGARITGVDLNGQTICHVPDTLGGYPVVSIASSEEVFQNRTELVEAALPDGMKLLDAGVFSGCTSLEKLNLNKVIYFSTYDEENGTDQEAASQAPVGMPALREVTVSDQNTAYAVEDGILYNRSRTALCLCPPAKKGPVIVPEGVEEISYKAFADCAAEAIVLPRTLKTIGAGAFSGCSGITEMHIPNQVQCIWGDTFTGCSSLREVFIPPAVSTIDHNSGLVRTDLVIRGAAGSYAQEWAEEYGVEFLESGYDLYAQKIVCPLADSLVNLTYGQGKQLLEAEAMTRVICTSSDSNVVEVSGNTFLGPWYYKPVGGGDAVITISAGADEIFAEAPPVQVKVHVTRAEQKLELSVPDIRYCGETGRMHARAKTNKSFKSSAPEIVSVGQTGKMRFLKPGKATITVTAHETHQYLGATKKVTVRSKLKTPTLKTRVSSGKVKITWSKVPGANQYQLYVRYPGKRKYRLALTRSSKVKSVTHKGLVKNGEYCYKVRVRTKVGGKWRYSRFSQVEAVKVGWRNFLEAN